MVMVMVMAMVIAMRMGEHIFKCSYGLFSLQHEEQRIKSSVERGTLPQTDRRLDLDQFLLCLGFVLAKVCFPDLELFVCDQTGGFGMHLFNSNYLC